MDGSVTIVKIKDGDDRYTEEEKRTTGVVAAFLPEQKTERQTKTVS